MTWHAGSPGSVLPSVSPFHFPFWQVGLHHYLEFHLLAPPWNENMLSFNYLRLLPASLKRPALKWNSKKHTRIGGSEAHENQPRESSHTTLRVRAKALSSLGNRAVAVMAAIFYVKVPVLTCPQGRMSCQGSQGFSGLRWQILWVTSVWVATSYVALCLLPTTGHQMHLKVWIVPL